MKHFSHIPSSTLIINCDDLGWNAFRDKGVLSLLEYRKIASSTVLINGHNALNSVEYARARDFPLGLHINMTEGLPIRRDIKGNSLLKREMFQSEPGAEEVECEVFHGKFGFFERIKEGKIEKEHVVKEIQAQIETFVRAYRRLPTHIDGHNHVHIIPEIAEILSEVMANFWGIYKVRVPNEDLSQSEPEFSGAQKAFIENLVPMIKESKLIYEKRNIECPDHFLGLGTMGPFFKPEKVFHYLSLLAKASKNTPFSLELMSHAGFASENWGDEFNRSSDREIELKTLSSGVISDNLCKFSMKLGSYRDLNHSCYEETFNVLICGDLSPASGNLIQCMRIKKALESIEKIRVFLSNIHILEQDEGLEGISSDLERLLVDKRINCVICVNVWKNARLFHQFMTETKGICIPYILMIAGTDANVAIKNSEKRQIIEKFSRGAYRIVSLTEPMKKIFEDLIPGIPPVSLIFNSADVSTTSKFSLRAKLKIPKEAKLVILPASIRKIKDVLFAIEAMTTVLIAHADHYFMICGSIREQEYYDSCRDLLDAKIKAFPDLKERIGMIDYILYEDFLSVLRETDLILNTSFAEGMSGSIIEAQLLGIPVLVRNNDGNMVLVKDNENGMVFGEMADFREKYERVFGEKGLAERLAKKGLETVKEFDCDKEKKEYVRMVTELRSDCYKEVPIQGNSFRILVPKEVHQVFPENNEIFSKICPDLERNEGSIRVLDLACGCGIFGFFALANLDPSLKISEMLFADISVPALRSVDTNFKLNSGKIRPIENVRIVESDMFEKIEGKFDLITANFPQTASLEPLRGDRWGKETGGVFNNEFIRKVKGFTHSKSLIFMLHISTSDPKGLDQAIHENGFIKENIFVQKRRVNRKEFDKMSPKLFVYLLELRNQGNSTFEVEHDAEGEWVCYDAELLKITVEKLKT